MIIDPAGDRFSLASIPDPPVVTEMLLTSCVQFPARFTNVVGATDLTFSQVYNAFFVALFSTLPFCLHERTCPPLTGFSLEKIIH